MKDMRGRNAVLPKSPNSELTFAEVAESVEVVFGHGCVGLSGGASECVTDEARSAFVRASLYLIVKQQIDGHSCDVLSAGELKRGINRKVRREMAGLLNVDENEVFRLHHHAAGLRCKDEQYRRKVRAIERELSKKHGLGL